MPLIGKSRGIVLRYLISDVRWECSVKEQGTNKLKAPAASEDK
jgi:hypothetical protein